MEVDELKRAHHELVRARIEAGDLSGVLALLNNWQRLPALIGWHQRGAPPDGRPLEAGELRDLLAEWWTTTEGTHGCGTDRTVRLFRVAGFVADNPSTRRPRNHSPSAVGV